MYIGDDHEDKGQIKMWQIDLQILQKSFTSAMTYGDKIICNFLINGFVFSCGLVKYILHQFSYFNQS